MEINLEKFKLSDIKRLEYIMNTNSESVGRKKNYKTFIEWNIQHPKDLYWKIVLGEEMIGYIGFADALSKLTTRNLAKTKDLFLEIYLDLEYTGKGYGQIAFEKSMKYIPASSGVIFASTYISNTIAQKFFINKLHMHVVAYNKKYNVVILSTTNNYKIEKRRD